MQNPKNTNYKHKVWIREVEMLCLIPVSMTRYWNKRGGKLTKCIMLPDRFIRNLVSQNPLMEKERVLLSVSKFSEVQEDVKEPIRIYLNHDVVGHSLDKDCRNVGDIVKLGELLWKTKGTAFVRL